MARLHFWLGMLGLSGLPLLSALAADPTPIPLASATAEPGPDGPRFPDTALDAVPDPRAINGRSFGPREEAQGWTPQPRAFRSTPDARSEAPAEDSDWQVSRNDTNIRAIERALTPSSAPGRQQNSSDDAAAALLPGDPGETRAELQVQRIPIQRSSAALFVTELSEGELAGAEPSSVAPLEPAPAVELAPLPELATNPALGGSATPFALDLRSTTPTETHSDKTPADITPADETPADETPADITRADEMPADGTSRDNTSAEEAPSRDTLDHSIAIASGPSSAPVWSDASSGFLKGTDAAQQASFVRVVEALGLPAIRAVEVEHIPAEALRAQARAHLSQAHSHAFFRMRQGTLSALGLLPGGFDLQRAVLETLPQQVLGLYDAERRVIALQEGLSVDLQQAVFVHEGVHALQDQHFQFRSLVAKGSRDDERARVLRALIEGQASRVTARLEGARASQDNAGEETVGASAPELLALLRADAPLHTPSTLRGASSRLHALGVAFLAAFEERFGASAGIFYSLPSTTEQLIHFEKYVSKEAPASLSMLELPFAVSAQWRQVDEMSLGELNTALWLGEAPGSLASSGWGNDSLMGFVGQSGQFMAAWRTVWDSEQDAIEFSNAARDRLRKRCVDADYVQQLPYGLLMGEGDRAFGVIRMGTEVRVLAGADRAELATLLQAAW